MSVPGEQEEHVRGGVEAAERGDIVGYFEHLAASHVLDGLTRGLRKGWPTADSESLHEAISTGVDSLYQALSSGRPVLKPMAYLYATAKNQLMHLSREQRMTVTLDEQLPSTSQVPGEDRPGEYEDALRAEALRTARGLLPKLGLQNVQAVMKVIFDAVEAGVPTLDNQMISEITGLTLETVRRSKSRGWGRLTQEARNLGLQLPEYTEQEGTDEPGE